MKCEGCPIGSLFEIVLTGGQGKEGEGCPARHMDCCHLTDTGKRIIKAMLAGEWKCETCKFSPWEGQCSRHVFLTPCIDWQPRDKPCHGTGRGSG